MIASTGADDRAENTAEDDVAGSHGLGRRCKSFSTEIVRQAEPAINSESATIKLWPQHELKKLARLVMPGVGTSRKNNMTCRRRL
jgi:hypothetical protein